MSELVTWIVCPNCQKEFGIPPWARVRDCLDVGRCPYCKVKIMLHLVQVLYK